MESKRKLEAKKLLEEMSVFEREYWEKGYVVGVDEVGRGPLAGPVTVCAYVFEKNALPLGVKDSKKLSDKKRRELFEYLINNAKEYSIVEKSPEVIDEINILEATKLAMKEAVMKLNVVPEIVLVDALTLDIPYKQLNIVKGDSKSISIAAASIIAKVTRDNKMIEYSKEFAEYGFENNKGYGTKEHINAIKEIGISRIHRKSFCKNFL